MNMKKLWFIPMILIIVSIAASIVAFQQSNLLNEGYIYIDGDSKEAIYAGEYVAIVGNTGDAFFMSVLFEHDYIEISTYNEQQILLDTYHLTVAVKGMSHDPSLISSHMDDQIVPIDEMDEYLLILYLDDDEIYDINLEVINDNPYTEDIDLAFAHIPEHIYNLKTLMEGVAMTTLIFTIVSVVTITAIIFIRKNR